MLPLRALRLVLVECGPGRAKRWMCRGHVVTREPGEPRASRRRGQAGPSTSVAFAIASWRAPSGVKNMNTLAITMVKARK